MSSKVVLKSIPTGIEDNIEFSFFDEEKNESIGKIEYDLNKRNKKAYINYTYLVPDRRGEHILTSLIDKIFCKMQCEGMKKVRLHTIEPKATGAWTKLGFDITGVEEFIGGNTHTYMERELPNNVCDCNTKKSKKV